MSVILHLVSLSPLDGSIRSREIDYTLTKNTLTEVRKNDTLDAPLGLKRVRASDLPKAGGLYGLSVVATTRDSAIDLLIKLASKEREKAALRASIMADGIARLAELKR